MGSSNQQYRDSFVQSVHSNTAVQQNDDELEKLRENNPAIKGPDMNSVEKTLRNLINNGACLEELDLLNGSCISMGGQASNFGRAVNILNEALNERSNPLPKDFKYSEFVSNSCTFFLGFTSNQITTGNREIIKYLMEHKLVDCVVTTCGAIEEDIIKCMGTFFLGDFDYPGSELRLNGLQRYGNIISGNNVYCNFEELLMPLLDHLLVSQINDGSSITISEFIHKLGEMIEDENSFCYWAYKNNIPIFCPGILDGAIGDVMVTHSIRSKSHLFSKCDKLKDACEESKDYINLDGTADLIKLTKMSIYSIKKASLLIGGSLPKHHINNACLLGGGSDYTVYINTGIPFDCSDSGADVDEAVSWGKVKSKSKAVKIFCEATLCFPNLVKETFVKYRLKK